MKDNVYCLLSGRLLRDKRRRIEQFLVVKSGAMSLTFVYKRAQDVLQALFFFLPNMFKSCADVSIPFYTGTDLGRL
jgi:hypothetical protein